MTLSNAERIRLEKLEYSVRQLAVLVRGGGSKNQLNRLLVLAQNDTKKLLRIVEYLENEMKEILDKVRKLQ